MNPDSKAMSLFRGQSTQTTRVRGFTLIELLVVLAIITILMGMLLPSLARAQHQARQVICCSNLRQWGISVRLYADIYDGFLPRRGQGVNPTQQVNRPTDWFNALPAAIGQKAYFDLAASGKVPRPADHSIFSCPEATDTGDPNFWSYGMNMWLSVWEATPTNHPDKFNAVGEPATMVFLADGPGSYCSVSPAPASYGYSPVARHSGQVNIVFLDGHVATLPAAYVGCDVGFVEHPDVRWRVEGSTWSSAQH